MAKRKKKDSGGGGGSPAWMATFSDLMNLLLCFFVLLFAFSSVDAEKFAEIAASFNSSLSIFDGGAEAIGDGKLISQGISQLDNLSEYYNEMGVEADKEKSEENDVETEFREKVAEEEKEATKKLYEKVVEVAEEKQIADTVEVNTDKNNQYVRIQLNGAILFDTGAAEIKKEALPILSKIGDILKTYDKHLIIVEGHTDNVPIRNNKYESNMWLSTARATRVFEYLAGEKGLDPKTLEASGRAEYEPIAKNDTPEGRAKNRRVEIKIYTDVDE